MSDSREQYRQDRLRQREQRDKERESSKRRSRSRSPHHRSTTPRREREHHHRHHGRNNNNNNNYRKPTNAAKENISGQDRDQRTVFVQQLAARLRTRELWDFFEKAGKVRDASIVKDRVTNRSKGVAYVEFEELGSVTAAIALTGERLLGIPLIVQYTESEKNRQAAEKAKKKVEDDRAEAVLARGPTKIAIGNVDNKLTEQDIIDVFRPFGEPMGITLPMDEDGKRKGVAFLRFKDGSSAANAVEKMNGFELAGRSLRVSFDDSKANTAKPETEDSRQDHVEENEKEEEENAPVWKQVSQCLVLKNMFDPDTESGDNWATELEEDVKEECEEKYGPVLHISVDAASEGYIYVKFGTSDHAAQAVEKLDGRKFDGRQVSAELMSEIQYGLRFPKSTGLS